MCSNGDTVVIRKESGSNPVCASQRACIYKLFLYEFNVLSMGGCFDDRKKQERLSESQVNFDNNIRLDLKFLFSYS